MNSKELRQILDDHRLWLANEGGERADLSGADLPRANLYRADLYGADLYRANLYRADLSESDLSRANLSEANLYRADLSGADLYRADLSRANLYRADLSGANLSGANLSGANLYRAVGNMREMKTIITDNHPMTYTHDTLQIGCERHPIADWWKFGDERIAKMETGAVEWWAIWKPILQNIIAVSPAKAPK